MSSSSKTAKSAKPSAKRGGRRLGLPRVRVGEQMFRHLPYFGFLSLLALAMVYNVHRAQSTLRSIETARAELQELRWRASAVQSRINYDNKQSEVLRRMRREGLGLAGTSPQRIVARGEPPR